MFVLDPGGSREICQCLHLPISPITPLSLTPITFDVNTFSCYGGSYFATIAVIFVICQRTLNVVGPSMPTSLSLFIPAIIAYFIHSMFLCRIVFCLYHSAPDGAAVVYINNSHIFSSGLHYTSMGHARLVCTHLYIVSHLVEGRIYRFLPSPTDYSIRSHSCSPLQHHSPSKKH